MNDIDIEKTSRILESVVSGYPESSEEYEAIRLAAIAVHFVWQDQVRARFKKFLDDFDRELTEEEEEHLRNMGI